MGGRRGLEGIWQHVAFSRRSNHSAFLDKAHASVTKAHESWGSKLVNLDLGANRRGRKYSGGELVRRVLWWLCWPAFRFSPRVCFGWRRLFLRSFGARVGKHVHVYSTAEIYMPGNLTIGDWSAIGARAIIYNLGPVTIGSSVTISQRAHLCAGTHDYTMPGMPLVKPPISIGDEAWICADAFVGPGVVVGPGAVVGARAVALTNVPAWSVVVGNPARILKKRVIQSDRSAR
jgi:putative colanic acid biosynthesis acetyltransferase WcaF